MPRPLLVSALALLLTAGPAAAQPKGGAKPAPSTPAPATPAAPTPAPAPAPAAGGADAAADAAVRAAAEAGPGADVDALRQEYLKLRDELFASRARAAAVASSLYSTKITLKLTYTSGRFYNVRRATVRLDGASVYDDTEGAISGDDAVRFEGYVAPGRHLVTVRVEAAGKDDDRFTSTTEATAVVVAEGGKDLVVAARSSDGGDIPYAWKKEQQGSYQLHVDIGVKTVARADAGGGAGAGKK